MNDINQRARELLELENDLNSVYGNTAKALADHLWRVGYRKQAQLTAALAGGEQAAPVGVVASPAQCRNRLEAEGKAYPRSGCAVCKTGGLTGCPYEKAVHTLAKQSAAVSKNLPDAEAGDFDCPKAEASRNCLCGFCRALRSFSFAVVSAPAKFKLGDLVTKIKGSNWTGTVVGTYSTELTPEGYAVESSTEKGSVQIYPAAALKKV